MHSATRTAADKPRQLLGLDLLRLCAALLVMLHHYCWALGVYGSRPTPAALANVAWMGFVGVQIFFVLSGFVIAYSAQHTTAVEFVRSRLIRLFPAAWICATVTLLCLLASGSSFPRLAGGYLGSMLLSPVGPWIDSVYWTLGVELMFYLIIFALLLARRFDLVGRAMSVVGIVSTLCLFYAATALLGWPHPARMGGRFAHQVFNDTASHLLLLTHGAFFALGTLLWLCLFDRVTGGRVAVVFVCLFGCLLDLRVHASWLVEHFPNRHWTAAVFLWFAAVVLIVVSVKGNDAFHRAIGVRGARIVRRAGLLTYPFYLLHQFAGYVVLKALWKHLPFPVSALVTGALFIALALLINLYAEAPLQSWMRRRLASRKPALAPAATLP